MELVMRHAQAKIAVMPIVVMEEVPVLSDGERAELLASLKVAEQEIANGDFDVLTRESMRAEYEASRR